MLQYAILYVLKGGIPWRMMPLDFRALGYGLCIFVAGINAACGSEADLPLNEQASLKQGKISHSPPMRFWIRNRSKRSMLVRIEAPMGKKRAKAVNATSPPIRWAICSGNIQLPPFVCRYQAKHWEVCDRVAETYD